jgi:muramoyltetrapeptide carboxypeptidase
MQKVRYLTPGDLIAVVAPAGKVTPDQVDPSVSWLEKRGYRVWKGEHLFGSYFQFSGTDEERTSDLQAALDHPEVRAILFARGGYGTIRVISKLQFGEFRLFPKWLAGFSDITILHSVCSRLQIPSIHGAMLKGALDESGNPGQSLLSLIYALEGRKPHYEISHHPLERMGSAAATVVGGNLSLLYSLLGTPFDIDMSGKILFIEETGEFLYHTDRMMHSLRLAGKLQGLKGLVVGQFSDMKDNPEPFGKEVEEIISGVVADYTFPVCFGFPAGHDSINLPVIFGNKWELNVQKEGVTFREI